MAKSESQLELADTKLASRFGWWKEKGSMDGSGDSIYIKHGRCFYVERKRPNKKQQANQIKFERLIKSKYETHYYLVDCKNLNVIREIILVEEYHNGFSTLKPDYYEDYENDWTNLPEPLQTRVRQPRV
jgi:hypothetical protein